MINSSGSSWHGLHQVRRMLRLIGCSFTSPLPSFCHKLTSLSLVQWFTLIEASLDRRLGQWSHSYLGRHSDRFLLFLGPMMSSFTSICTSLDLISTEKPLLLLFITSCINKVMATPGLETARQSMCVKTDVIARINFDQSWVPLWLLSEICLSSFIFKICNCKTCWLFDQY